MVQSYSQWLHLAVASASPQWRQQRLLLAPQRKRSQLKTASLGGTTNILFILLRKTTRFIKTIGTPFHPQTSYFIKHIKPMVSINWVMVGFTIVYTIHTRNTLATLMLTLSPPVQLAKSWRSLTSVNISPSLHHGAVPQLPWQCCSGIAVSK